MRALVMASATRRPMVGTAINALLVPVVMSATGCLPHEKNYETTAASQVGTAPEGVGLPVGANAPDAELMDSFGAKTRLLAGADKGLLLVIFYKGGWCPSCNVQMHDFSVHYTEFSKRGVALVGVSVDKPDYLSTTRNEYSLPFPVLSDPTLVAHSAYHVVDHVSGVGAFMLARMGANLAERSGQDHHNVAIPSLFLVDARHKVRFRHADKDYGTRPSQKQILAAIDAVLASAASGSEASASSATTPAPRVE